MTCENLTRGKIYIFYILYYKLLKLGSNLEVINNEILVENSICEL